MEVYVLFRNEEPNNTDKKYDNPKQIVITSPYIEDKTKLNKFKENYVYITINPRTVGRIKILA